MFGSQFYTLVIEGPKMPIISSTNNRIIPANARASDVAARALREVSPVQQARTMSAMRVQGYPALLYNRLTQGPRCSCQSADKQLNSRLDLEGKAKPGFVNELLTGSLTFDVSPYSNRPLNIFGAEVSPTDETNPYQGVFDLVANEITSLPSDIGPEFGDNGPLLDVEESAFDHGRLGYTDARCAICFGTGFVSGYTAFNTYRKVLTVNDVELTEATLDVQKSPWSATAKSFSFSMVLPLGALGLDSFRVYNNCTPLGANFTIDLSPASAQQVLNKCDGRPHEIHVTFPQATEWTHIEIQLALSSQSAYFEFPRLNKGSDTSLLEQLDPFSITMGPNVPVLNVEDIIVESVFGKTLIVQNSNWWNDRNRSVLGWECQVRVLQPQEIYTLLPRRGRVMTKAPTALKTHDNQPGNRT